MRLLKLARRFAISSARCKRQEPRSNTSCARACSSWTATIRTPWPAHHAVFADIRPAATMVVVADLLDPRWKVEIEAEALIDA